MPPPSWMSECRPRVCPIDGLIGRCRGRRGVPEVSLLRKTKVRIHCVGSGDLTIDLPRGSRGQLSRTERQPHAGDPLAPCEQLSDSPAAAASTRPQALLKNRHDDFYRNQTQRRLYHRPGTPRGRARIFCRGVLPAGVRGPRPEAGHRPGQHRLQPAEGHASRHALPVSAGGRNEARSRSRGAVLDIIVDLRPESPTYLQHVTSS